jgi:hypothetical protein
MVMLSFGTTPTGETQLLWGNNGGGVPGGGTGGGNVNLPAAAAEGQILQAGPAPVFPALWNDTIDAGSF